MTDLLNIVPILNIPPSPHTVAIVANIDVANLPRLAAIEHVETWIGPLRAALNRVGLEHVPILAIANRDSRVLVSLLTKDENGDLHVNEIA